VEDEMSTPARKIERDHIQLDRLEAELLDLPPRERGYLAHLLLDSLGPASEDHEHEVAAEAHCRWLQYKRGEIEALDEDASIADLEARLQRIEVEQVWAAEAHRRWEAYQRGEEEMVPFEEVMAEIRSRPGT
jgi:putative addiction module component (TIGR02574 family)